ncbi:MAG: hypothetical protein LBE13_02090 [Bacteroidales bacterium]|jgi:hypothetical protein|nr:hypothetical protein [Bacteroidales bacterium]
MDWFGELFKGVRFSFCGITSGKNEYNGEHRVNVSGLCSNLSFIVSTSVFSAYPGDNTPIRIFGKLGRKSGTTYAGLIVDDVVYNVDPKFQNVSQEDITRGCVFTGYGLLTEKREYNREGVVYNSILLGVLGDIIKITNFADGVFSSIPDVGKNDRLLVHVGGVCSNSLSYNARYNSHGGICVPYLESLSVKGSLPIGSAMKFVPVGESTNSTKKNAA